MIVGTLGVNISAVIQLQEFPLFLFDCKINTSYYYLLQISQIFVALMLISSVVFKPILTKSGKNDLSGSESNLKKWTYLSLPGVAGVALSPSQGYPRLPHASPGYDKYLQSEFEYY